MIDLCQSSASTTIGLSANMHASLEAPHARLVLVEASLHQHIYDDVNSKLHGIENIQEHAS